MAQLTLARLTPTNTAPIALALSLLLLGVGEARAGDAKAEHAAIERQLEVERYKDALKAAKLSVAKDPSLSRGWLLKGRAHLGLEQFKLALESFRKAQKLAPRDPRPLRYVGLTEMTRGTSAALKAWREGPAQDDRAAKRMIKALEETLDKLHDLAEQAYRPAAEGKQKPAQAGSVEQQLADRVRKLAVRIGSKLSAARKAKDRAAADLRQAERQGNMGRIRTALDEREQARRDYDKLSREHSFLHEVLKRIRRETRRGGKISRRTAYLAHQVAERAETLLRTLR